MILTNTEIFFFLLKPTFDNHGTESALLLSLLLGIGQILTQGRRLWDVVEHVIKWSPQLLTKFSRVHPAKPKH